MYAIGVVGHYLALQFLDTGALGGASTIRVGSGVAAGTGVDSPAQASITASSAPRVDAIKNFPSGSSYMATPY